MQEKPDDGCCCPSIRRRPTAVRRAWQVGSDRHHQRLPEAVAVATANTTSAACRPAAHRPSVACWPIGQIQVSGCDEVRIPECLALLRLSPCSFLELNRTKLRKARRSERPRPPSYWHSHVYYYIHTTHRQHHTFWVYCTYLVRLYSYRVFLCISIVGYD